MSTPAARAAKEGLVAEARRDGSGGALVAVQLLLADHLAELVREVGELRRVLEPVAAEQSPGPERREYMDLSQLRDTVGEDDLTFPNAEHVHEWTRPHGQHGARQCATCREVTL